MPYIRKLPSGKWQATVRMPNGDRVTETDVLKRVVEKWAKAQEAAFDRGEVRDPRAGQIKVADWYARCIAARSIEDVTKDKLESAWRTHCGPKWGTWPMSSITHMEAQEWVKAMETTKRAKHRGRSADDQDDVPVLAASTVHVSVHLMSSLYKAALAEHPPIVASNPFSGLDLPTATPNTIYYYEHEEADALIAAVRKLRPAEPQWPVLIAMGMWVGLRPGELFGLHGHRVNFLRRRVQVAEVMTRRGLREYPKSTMSHREVPVPAWILDEAAPLLEGRARDALLLTMPQGGVIRDPDFRHRIWYPAVREAGVRPYPPRVMRHTAASWLVQDGVPLYDVQKLLGHESYTTTMRYAHLAPDAHGRVLDSWRRTGDARGVKIS